MLRHSPRTLLSLLVVCLCLRAFSQESRNVRIGVALPSSGPQSVSDVEIRDRLLKALNEEKLDRKLSVELQAIALSAPPGGRAAVEAKAKDCAYVLYIDVKPGQKTFKFEAMADGSFVNVPSVNATVDYLIRRIDNDTTYAAGTVKAEDSASDRDVLLQALRRTAHNVIGELAKGTGSRNSHTESGALEKIVPTRNRDEFSGEQFCAWLPSGVEHSDALRGVCEYAMTLPQRMPNFVCHQSTSRFVGHNKVPADLVTATVRYEDGDESYSDLQLNGKPVAEAAARTAGLWSSGQLSGTLRAIFHDRNHATFAFAGEKKIGQRQAWVFTYSIAKQNEPLWQLRADENVLAPPYGGEVWVDSKTGGVLKFVSSARDLPRSFPIQSCAVMTEYQDVAFGDGTSFVLPASSSVTTQFAGFDPTRNVVEFSGCHKFRARARMVTDVAPEPSEKSTEVAGSADLLTTEEEEEETIYAILREQAIHEDAARLEAEQQLDLYWSAVAVVSRLAALERQRQRNAAQIRVAAADPGAPLRESVTTFKVNVKLVPVSVVVRDSNGRAVGNLTKADFHLFDERKPQPISSFSVEKASGQHPSADHESTVSGETFVVGEQKQAAPANNVAYVFDDLHLTFEDIENAKDAATRHFAEMNPEDHAAIFTTSGAVELNFTGDAAQLKSAVHALKSHARSGAGDCPPMTYYMADLIINQGDPDDTENAISAAVECTFHGVGKPDGSQLEKARQLTEAKAFELLSTGRVESENALQNLQQVTAATAAVSGRRSIVLVSPGFLALDPDDQDRAMAIIDHAVQAGVIVSTLDVRGVLSTSVSATARDLANTGQFERQEATANAALMADFATGTGGTYFHNNNNLEQGFRQTADVPEYIYVLGFSPGKLDGKFHKLKVRLASGEKLTVQARAGYYAVKALVQ